MWLHALSSSKARRGSFHSGHSDDDVSMSQSELFALNDPRVCIITEYRHVFRSWHDMAKQNCQSHKTQQATMKIQLLPLLPLASFT